MRGTVLFAVIGTLALAAAGQTASAGDQLKLKLIGQLPETCELVDIGSEVRRQIDLSTSGSDTLDFEIDCNQPVTVTLRSENGALVNQNPAFRSLSDGAQWIAEVPYVATISVDRVGLRGQADSRDMNGRGVSFSSRQIPFDSPASVTLAWRQVGPNLLSGNYGDVVRVTVSADQSGG